MSPVSAIPQRSWYWTETFAEQRPRLSHHTAEIGQIKQPLKSCVIQVDQDNDAGGVVQVLSTVDLVL